MFSPPPSTEPPKIEDSATVDKTAVYRALQSFGLKNSATVELYKSNGRVLVEVVEIQRKANQFIQTSSLFILNPGESKLVPVSADSAQPGKAEGKAVYILYAHGTAPETIYRHFDSFPYLQANNFKPIP